MKISSKFNIKDEIWLVNLPWATKATTENIRIVPASIKRVIFTEEGILYDASGDMYYSDNEEKHIFNSKDEAEIWVFKKYFKGTK